MHTLIHRVLFDGWVLLYHDARLQLAAFAHRTDPDWPYVVMLRGACYYPTKASEVLSCLTVLTAAQFPSD